MKLDNFYFDVAEKEVLIAPFGSEITHKVPGYKAIVKPGETGDKVISIVKDSYRLVPNRQIIEPFLEQVSKLNVRWYIDKSHSFAAINRMRLQVTFPDLHLADAESKIPLSMYLHNSYDMSEGVRLYFGAIRAICSNGCVFGEILGKHYAKHTKLFDMADVGQHFGKAVDKLGELQSHIDHWQSVIPNQQVMDELQSLLGKRRLEEILSTDCTPEKSMWALFNDITYHISHKVEKERRAELQLKLSRVFPVDKV